MKASRGFTMIELLVVVGIIGALVALIMPALNEAIITTQRNACMANIKQLANACITYAQNEQFHIGSTHLALPAVEVATNWADPATGNSACLWLLAKHGFAARDLFLCPEAGARLGYREPDSDDAAFEYDAVTEVSTLSYSYISMVDPITREETRLGTDLQSSLIILADKNPRVTFGDASLDPIVDDYSPNSNNHNAAGQNVARIDQSAHWTDETSSAVSDDDDIYAAYDDDDDSDGERTAVEDAFCVP